MGRQIALRARDEGYRVSVYGRRAIEELGIEQARLEFRDGKLVGGAPPDVDVVINSLACYRNVGDNGAEMEWVNRDLPVAVLRAYFLDASFCQHRPNLFLNVDSALRSGVSSYATTKTELRSKLETFANEGLPIVGLRLDQFYGPADGRGKFVTMLALSFLNKAVSIPLSSGQQRRRFLFVTDAIDALMDVVEKALRRELTYSKETAALLPALGDSTLVREVVHKVQEACHGHATRLDFGALADRGVETDPPSLAPGFEFLESRPVVRIEDGIRKLVDFERREFELKTANQIR